MDHTISEVIKPQDQTSLLGPFCLWSLGHCKGTNCSLQQRAHTPSMSSGQQACAATCTLTQRSIMAEKGNTRYL